MRYRISCSLGSVTKFNFCFLLIFYVLLKILCVLGQNKTPMWVKNMLGNLCLYCSVSAEVHPEQFRPSLGAVDQKFSDGIPCTDFSVTSADCRRCPSVGLDWPGVLKVWTLLQSVLPLARAFQTSVPSATECKNSSDCLMFPSLWLTPWPLLHVVLPGYAHIHCCALWSFSEPSQWSQILLPPILGFLYMSVFIHRPFPHPGSALPCTLYYLASWETSASALVKLWMKFVFLLEAGWFMFSDIHRVHYEGFYPFASRFFFTM